METGLTKQRVIAELTRSPHGALAEYLPIAVTATKEDPEFFAHLIAWNQIKGQVRDAKVALPLAPLMVAGFPFAENSLAHLAKLDPRNFLRGLRWAKEIRMPAGNGRPLRRLVERYLRAREAKTNWWIATAIQHRASLKGLYAQFHVRPAPLYDAMLFKGVRPPGTALAALAELKTMPPSLMAAAITQHRLPFLVVTQALGGRMKETDVLMALIDQMSASELVSNSKMLERLGIRDVPALRAAYEVGLQRVADSKEVSLKTTRAAAAVGDEKLKAKLVAAQERQLRSMSVKGNWLVLGDKSGSMQHAIEASRHIAATLAKMVEGEVNLIFFNTSPFVVKVTGKTYDEVLAMTKNVVANGGTGIGCGLEYALEKGWEINGIAIVSDGGENSPPLFSTVYQKYCEKFGTEPPVYFYQLQGTDSDRFSATMRGNLQTFDLRGGLDYYSLPNLVETMRASRYSLLDEIMETKLLTLDEVFA